MRERIIAQPSFQDAITLLRASYGLPEVPRNEAFYSGFFVPEGMVDANYTEKLEDLITKYETLAIEAEE